MKITRIENIASFKKMKDYYMLKIRDEVCKEKVKSSINIAIKEQQKEI